MAITDQRREIWSHLRRHLDISWWPLQCLHPLCNTPHLDKVSFLFHLSNAHSLQGSSPSDKSRTDLPSSVSLPLGNGNRKRKVQEKDKGKLEPSKQGDCPPTIDLTDERSRPPVDDVPSIRIQTVSPNLLSRGSFAAMDDTPQSLCRI